MQFISWFAEVEAEKVSECEQKPIKYVIALMHASRIWYCGIQSKCIRIEPHVGNVQKQMPFY